MNVRKIIKHNARETLTGKWPAAMLATAFLLLFTLGFSLLEAIAISLLQLQPVVSFSNQIPRLLPQISNLEVLQTAATVLSALLSLLFTSPIALGVRRWFYRLTPAEPESISSVFWYFSSFSNYCKAVWMNIALSLRIFFWGILLMILPFGFFFFGTMIMQLLPQNFMMIFAGLAYIMAILGVLVLTPIWIILILRYFLTPYFLIEHPEISVRQAIKLSVQGMKHNKAEVFFFEFSMIGWRLLATLLLPELYVTPYYETSRALFARYLMLRKQ